MTSSNEKTKRWRGKIKEKCLKLMGGKCILCGYDYCNQALEFHHIDKNGKEFSISTIIAGATPISEILEELKKCVILCANCHREVHYKNKKIENYKINVTENDIIVFLNNGINWDMYNLKEMLQKMTLDEIKTEINCSLKVLKEKIEKDNLLSYYKNSRYRNKHIKISKEELEKLLKEKHTLEKISKHFGISTTTLRIRMKKFGLVKTASKIDASKEELEKLISENPFTHVGKMFNVSDNAIRKRWKF